MQNISLQLKKLYNCSCPDLQACTLSHFVFMGKEVYIVSSIVGIVTSLICLFFDWKISTGIIIGLISSLIYFFILSKTFKLNDDGSINKGNALLFIVRIFVIALPLLIACLLPDVFNIFGAFGGVMLFRFVMMFYFFKKKGEV